MLKALYDFQAVYPKTISFDEGEHFILYQTSARQRNWWQVVSMKGAIGFVPSNYVMKIKVNILMITNNNKTYTTDFHRIDTYRYKYSYLHKYIYFYLIEILFLIIFCYG